MLRPELADIAARQNDVFTTEQARSSGYTVDEIRSRRESGAWSVVRRGVYIEASSHPVDARTAHLRLARAALLATHCEAIVSHRSAAVLHRLPLLTPLAVVELTAPRELRRRAPGVDVKTTRTPIVDAVEIEGLPVTSAARTVVDLSRTLDLAGGVVVADAALRTEATTREELAEQVAASTSWGGHAQAVRVLEIADAGSGSAAESLARLALVHQGLPTPTLHPQLRAGLEGPVPMLWLEQRVAACLAVGDANDERVQRRLNAMGFVVLTISPEDISYRAREVANHLRTLMHARRVA